MWCLLQCLKKRTASFDVCFDHHIAYYAMHMLDIDRYEMRCVMCIFVFVCVCVDVLIEVISNEDGIRTTSGNISFYRNAGKSNQIESDLCDRAKMWKFLFLEFVITIMFAHSSNIVYASVCFTKTLNECEPFRSVNICVCMVRFARHQFLNAG